MLSISQNNICLPARAFKTINKIRERTMATVPLLPPSLCLLLFFSPLYFPPFCSSSFASTMQTFSGLSAPPLLRERQQKTSLCRQTAMTHIYTKTHMQRQQINTQEHKLTQTLIHSCQRQTFTFAYTHTPLSACNQPALVLNMCRANGEK